MLLVASFALYFTILACVTDQVRTRAFVDGCRRACRCGWREVRHHTATFSRTPSRTNQTGTDISDSCCPIQCRQTIAFGSPHIRNQSDNHAGELELDNLLHHRRSQDRSADVYDGIWERQDGERTMVSRSAYHAPGRLPDDG
jgi:hypothetical protein